MPHPTSHELSFSTTPPRPPPTSTPPLWTSGGSGGERNNTKKEETAGEHDKSPIGGEVTRPSPLPVSSSSTTPSSATTTPHARPCRRREEAGWWSRWTFSFFNDMMGRGSTRPLDLQADYAGVESRDDARHLSGLIQAAWKADAQAGRPTGGRLLRVLFRTFGWEYAKGGLAFTCESAVKIGEAYTLALLLRWFQQGARDVSPQGVSLGYVYAGILSALALCHAFLHHMEFFLCMRVGTQIRVALISAIYRKAMRLSSSHTSSSGYIVNLVSNDVQRFEDAAPFAHFLWLGPLECLVVLYLLWVEISWAAFAAVGTLLLFIPLQGYFASIFGALRRRTVEHRDDRIHTISDMLAGMMVVKLYRWERPFTAKIQAHRDAEMREVAAASRYRALNESFFCAASSIVIMVAFVIYFFVGGAITASLFSVLAYVNFLVLDMTNFVPKALQFLAESRISLTRIEGFLALEEMGARGVAVCVAQPAAAAPAAPAASAGEGKDKAQAAKDDAASRAACITFAHANLQWEASETVDAPLALQDITFTTQGQLLAVCGFVGAGKTSLLNAVLGELRLVGGAVILTPSAGQTSPTIAYVNQVPWLLAGTIRENILFGAAYDEAWFRTVVRACALDVDFKSLPDGEHTFLGERGVNLSGGQRARLGLARAVYTRSDIYLLDDPLSAVDARVGRHLFDQVLRGLLHRATVLLVTHQLAFVQECDAVLLLEGGHITVHGPVEEVARAENPFFARFLQAEAEVEAASVKSASLDVGAHGPGTDGPRKRTHRAASGKLDEALLADQANASPSGKGAEAEASATGAIPLSVYKEYLLAGSQMPVVLAMAVALVAGEVGLVLCSWWLARWASTPAPSSAYAYIFIGLVLGTFALSTVRALVFFQVLVGSSKKLFATMCQHVVFTTMAFFNATPKGRILNRLSKDISLMDEMLPQTAYDFIQCFLMILGTLCVAVAIIPFVLVLLPFCLVAFYYLRRAYLLTSRQIKRMEAVTRSPVYATVTETLEGLPIIRAYRARERFETRFLDIQNDNTRVYFAFMCSSRWLGIRLDVMSSLFLVAVVFLSILLQGVLGLTPALIGFAISFTLQLVGLLQWAVRQSTEVENMMVSVERVLEYTKLPLEGGAHEPTGSMLLPPAWPEGGALSLRHLTLRYPGTEQLVLRDLCLDIPPGTKVGIVGRTGAGKSTLLQALFRLVEVEAGSIFLDGVDITSVSLEDLRSRISIIPQELACFKGTLRFNLDPFSRHPDEAVWQAVDAAQLGDVARAAPGKLEAPVEEGGSNWSMGQRQLICLARAILRNSRLLVMDEATSSVDLQTDALIQQAIRSQDGLFSRSTVLTIAHRLDTVIDYDLLVVLDAGSIVEVGHPHELLEKGPQAPGAWFARMVGELGPEARKLLADVARRAHAAVAARDP